MKITEKQMSRFGDLASGKPAAKPAAPAAPTPPAPAVVPTKPVEAVAPKKKSKK